MKLHLRDIILLTGVAAGFLALATLCYTVVPASPLGVPVLWLPVGWAVACTALLGARAALAVFLGSWVWYTNTIDAIPAMLFSVAQALQAWAVARTVWKYCAVQNPSRMVLAADFDKRDFAESHRKLLLATLLNGCIAPTLETLVLIAYGSQPLHQAPGIWVFSYLSGIVGILIVGPLIMAAGKRFAGPRRDLIPCRSIIVVSTLLALGPLLGILHWAIEHQKIAGASEYNLLQDLLTLVLFLILPAIGILIFRLDLGNSALSKEKEKLALIMNQIRDAVSLHQPDGRTLYTNAAYATLYSYHDKVPVAGDILSLFAPPEAEKLRAAFENACRNRSYEILTVPLMPAGNIDATNDSPRVVEVQIAPAGNLIRGDGVVCVSRDITNQNLLRSSRDHANAMLRESEFRLRSIIDASPSIIFTAEATDQICMTFVSGRAMEILGFTPDECLAKNWWREQVYTDDWESFWGKFSHHPEQGHLLCEFRMLTKTGEKVWVQSKSILVVDPIKNSCEIVGHIFNIDAERRVADSLRSSQKLEAIGQLTGGLAHDFNNLLGVVIGNLDVLGDKLPEDNKLRHAHHIALQAALRGAEVTRSLLAVARRQPMEIATTDMNALVAEMLPLIRSSAGSAVTVRTQLRLGELSAPLDAASLTNAVLNLVINARDAMRDQSTQKRIVLCTGLKQIPGENDLGLRAGTYATLEVQDNGPGMSEEVRSRAFEPFFTTKERGHGTGLGLAMVRGFAEQLGGTAQIESHSGSGTVIQIIVPVDAQWHAEVQSREARRLESLDLHRLADPTPEPAFELAVREAARACGTPMAALVIVDEDTLLIKSAFGFHFKNIPREHSFFGYLVDTGESSLVIEDASKDNRFSGNLFVEQEPRCRFYAGVPLLDQNNLVLGSLSVLDYSPRTLEPSQLARLQQLSSMLSDKIRSRLPAIQAVTAKNIQKAAMSKTPAMASHAEQDMSVDERKKVLVVDDEAELGEIACLWLQEIGYETEQVIAPRDGLSALGQRKFDILFTDVVMPGDLDGLDLAREALKRQPDLTVVLTSGYARNVTGRGGLPGTLIPKPYRKADLAKVFLPMISNRREPSP